jgi:hypothetical protein
MTTTENAYSNMGHSIRPKQPSVAYEGMNACSCGKNVLGGCVR